MKRYYSMVAFAAAALVLAGCSAEESVKPIEEETPEATKTIRITAMMPGSDTRVSIGDATGSSEEPTYPVNWNVGDKIYLLGVGKDGIGNNGGNDCFICKGTLTLKSGAGTSNAVFEGTVTANLSEITIAAYGSYDWAKAYTPNSFRVTINDNITDPDKIDSPMIATDINLTKNATIKFSHLAGAIRFDIKNLPTDAVKLRLKTYDSISNTSQISGYFKIETENFTNLAGWKPVLNLPTEIGVQTTGEETTIKLRDNKNGVYCFVLPVGTYEKGFSLDILNENDDILLTEGSSKYTIRDSKKFTINAGDIALYHIIDCDTINKSGAN